MSESEHSQIIDSDEFAQQQAENIINEDMTENEEDCQYTNDLFCRLGISSNQSNHNQTLLDQRSQNNSVLSNGEYILQQMANQDFRKTIQEGYQHLEPSLLLKITPKDDLEIELDERDIQGVFKRFGEVNVKVECQGKAQINFGDIQSAFFALKTLNGLEIPTQNIILNLSWLDESSEHSQESLNRNSTFPQQPHSGLNMDFDFSQSSPDMKTINKTAQIAENSSNQQLKAVYDDIEHSNNATQHSSTKTAQLHSISSLPNNHASMNVKYTCRYEIQIHNDKEFQVARKIIGSRGENMKSIIKKCSDSVSNNQQNQFFNDDDQGVKLRLRGRGSGYKEGPEKQESQDALHLCVSSTCYEMYRMACSFVEELLEDIYEQYFQMCSSKNLRREKIGIRKQESTNGKTVHPASSKQICQNTPLDGSYKVTNGNCSQKQTEIMKITPKKDSRQQKQQSKLCKSPTFQPKDVVNKYTNREKQQQFQQLLVEENERRNDELHSDFEENNLNRNNSNNPHPFTAIISDGCFAGQHNLKLTENQITNLIEQRNKARKESNYLEADRIRNYLKNSGVCLMDEKGGRGKGQEVTTWKFQKDSLSSSSSSSVGINQKYHSNSIQYTNKPSNHASKTYFVKSSLLLNYSKQE